MVVGSAALATGTDSAREPAGEAAVREVSDVPRCEAGEDDVRKSGVPEASRFTPTCATSSLSVSLAAAACFGDRANSPSPRATSYQYREPNALHARINTRQDSGWLQHSGGSCEREVTCGWPVRFMADWEAIGSSTCGCDVGGCGALADIRLRRRLGDLRAWRQVLLSCT